MDDLFILMYTLNHCAQHIQDIWHKQCILLVQKIKNNMILSQCGYIKGSGPDLIFTQDILDDPRKFTGALKYHLFWFKLLQLACLLSFHPSLWSFTQVQYMFHTFSVTCWHQWPWSEIIPVLVQVSGGDKKVVFQSLDAKIWSPKWCP